MYVYMYVYIYIYIYVYICINMCEKDGVVDWFIVQVEMPLTRFRQNHFMNSLKTST